MRGPGVGAEQTDGREEAESLLAGNVAGENTQSCLAVDFGFPSLQATDS